MCTETEQTAEKEGRQHGYQRSSRGTAKSSHVRGKTTVSTIDECPDVDNGVRDHLHAYGQHGRHAKQCARPGVRQPGTQGRHKEWQADGTSSEG